MIRVLFFVIIIVSLSFLILYSLSVIIMGELYFRFPRHRKYPVNPKKLGAKKIVLEDRKGMKIISWHLPANKNKLAIVIHGHFDNAGMMFERYIPIFTKANWDVLAIDLRNHGISDDEFPLTYGVREAIDVKLGIEWAIKHNNWEKITIFGTSMGSIAGLLATNASPHKIDGIVLDSSFISIDETLWLNLKKHRIPTLLYYKILRKYLELRYRSLNFTLNYFPNFKDELIKVATKCSVFVASGQLDNEIPQKDFYRIKKIIPNETFVLVPNGTHSRLYKSNVFNDALNQWLIKL